MSEPWGVRGGGNHWMISDWEFFRIKQLWLKGSNLSFHYFSLQTRMVHVCVIKKNFKPAGNANVCTDASRVSPGWIRSWRRAPSTDGPLWAGRPPTGRAAGGSRQLPGSSSAQARLCPGHTHLIEVERGRVYNVSGLAKKITTRQQWYVFIIFHQGGYVFVCLLHSKITQNLLDGLSWHLVEGGGIGQERHYGADPGFLFTFLNISSIVFCHIIVTFSENYSWHCLFLKVSPFWILSMMNKKNYTWLL